MQALRVKSSEFRFDGIRLAARKGGFFSSPQKSRTTWARLRLFLH